MTNKIKLWAACALLFFVSTLTSHASRGCSATVQPNISSTTWPTGMTVQYPDGGVDSWDGLHPLSLRESSAFVYVTVPDGASGSVDFVFVCPGEGTQTITEPYSPYGYTVTFDCTTCLFSVAAGYVPPYFSDVQPNFLGCGLYISGYQNVQIQSIISINSHGTVDTWDGTYPLYLDDDDIVRVTLTGPYHWNATVGFFAFRCKDVTQTTPVIIPAGQDYMEWVVTSDCPSCTWSLKPLTQVGTFPPPE